jgi:hypothetical protein
VWIVVGAMALTGCTAIRAWRFARGQKLITIHPESVVYKGCGADGYRFEMGLEFENLTKGTATLRDVRMTGSLDDRTVVSTVHDEALTIAAGETRPLRVPLVINPVHAAGGILGGVKTVRFDGSASVDLGILGERTFGFESVHDIRGLHKPRFVLEKINLGDTGVTAVRVQAVLRRVSRADTSLKAVSLKGEVVINGRTVGSLDAATHEVLPDAFAIHVTLRTLDTIWVTAHAVNTKRVDLEIRSVLEAESDRLKLEIPYRFEQKDVLGKLGLTE